VKRQELYEFFNSAETIIFVILKTTSVLYWKKMKNLTPGFRILRKVSQVSVAFHIHSLLVQLKLQRVCKQSDDFLMTSVHSSTCLCKQMFSRVKDVKVKCLMKSRITDSHLESLLCFSLSSIIPDIGYLVCGEWCQVWHQHFLLRGN
jgi:hypothetical protein